jgi:hypothetical protein
MAFPKVRPLPALTPPLLCPRNAPYVGALRQANAKPAGAGFAGRESGALGEEKLGLGFLSRDDNNHRLLQPFPLQQHQQFSMPFLVLVRSSRLL